MGSEMCIRDRYWDNIRDHIASQKRLALAGGSAVVREMQRSIQLHMAGADASVESEPTPDDQAPSQSGPGRADQLAAVANVKAVGPVPVNVLPRNVIQAIHALGGWQLEPRPVSQEMQRAIALVASLSDHGLVSVVRHGLVSVVRGELPSWYTCEHHLVERRKMVTNM